MAGNVKKMRGRRRKPEQGLHVAVAHYLDLALPDDAVAFHVPNGGTRNVIEAMTLKRMGVKAGVPDFIILHKGWGFGIELKAGKGGLSEPQIAMHAKFGRCGVPVAVCKSVDEVQAMLDKWGIPVHARTFGFRERAA